jgi:hypothetical protein
MEMVGHMENIGELVVIVAGGASKSNTTFESSQHTCEEISALKSNTNKIEFFVFVMIEDCCLTCCQNEWLSFGFPVNIPRLFREHRC